MILVNEIHTVEIELDGDRQTVATADLCGDDTLDDLRSRVSAISDTLTQAFDQAFERCEAQPGNVVVGRFACDRGEVIVTRALVA